MFFKISIEGCKRFFKIVIGIFLLQNSAPAQDVERSVSYAV